MRYTELMGKKRRMITRLYQQNSGHIGACLSCFEMVAAAALTCNHLILSKAHANYAYQAIMDGENIDDHVPGLGSLGYGLSIGIGHALANQKKTVAVICGDGEMNEGSIWESVILSGRLNTRNLVLMIDRNTLQGLDIIPLDPFAYYEMLEGAGWFVQQLPGHDVETMVNALSIPRSRPKAIICETIKGNGIPFMEHNNAWHYRTMTTADYTEALKCLE